MRVALPLLLSLAALAAGCAAPAGEPAEDPLPAADAPAAAPAPAEAAPTPQEEPAEPPKTAAGPRKVESRAEMRTPLLVGTPCPDGGTGCAMGLVSFPVALDVPEPGPARATLTATWDATTPAAAQMFVHFQGPDGLITEAKGASPLVLDVPAEALAKQGAYEAYVSPDLPGAMVEQTVAFVLLLEYA